MKIMYKRPKLYFIGWVSCLLAGFLLSACNGLPESGIPTPLPAEYVPTVIAMTLEANRSVSLPETAIPATLALPTQVPSATAEAPSLTSTFFLTPTLPPPFATTEIKPTTPPPANQPPEIPNAEIGILNLGQLSRVASPIPIRAYLKPGANYRVQVDLLGEDQRMLARQIVVVPWVNRQGMATISMKLDFEIPGTAEAGRLVISVADEFGRSTALNSVPLILISIGESDILPPANKLASIAIKLPARKTLIQGKNLLVYGFARPSSNGYLMMQLITEDGRVIGKRVTNVEAQPGTSYGTFAAEVPFSVSEPTPALLVVWEGEGSLSNIVYLTSVEVLLSP
jgi:hypothetical protein